MNKRPSRILSWLGIGGADEPPPRHVTFRLVRYFTTTSLVALTVVGFAFYFLERAEETFFAAVQREQGEFFAQAQAELARQHEENARNDLLLVHEAAHVNLTRVFANTLWKSDFAPFLNKVQQFPVEQCRAIATDQQARKNGLTPVEARECFASLGRKIMSVPEFGALDAKVHALMRNSTVFKIKAFDLRGITIYSSEHSQIGEDKANNHGWMIAAGGVPASEVTHRDRFSAFERVVENRDLISSYIPRMGPDGTTVLGVFEIYSDITPFLEQIKIASEKMRKVSEAHQKSVREAAVLNQEKVHASADRLLAIMGGLLVALYVGLFVIVRNGQRIIDKQARAQEWSVQREQQWHREKMAALATMAANVAHEVGNPLATISALAENIASKQTEGACPDCRPQEILKQTDRIATMTRQIADFAAARSESSEPVDVNQMVKAVCDFLGHDRRFHGAQIEFRPGTGVPARTLVPDLLNETMMSLLQACAQRQVDNGAVPEQIVVETAVRGEDVVVSIRYGSNADVKTDAMADSPPDSRFESARRRVAEMGGGLSHTGHVMEISLPSSA